MSIFDKHFKEYDEWYEKNKPIFFSEFAALKKTIPSYGIGLEIGVGTGRFASELNLSYGIDPSFEMLKIAKKRGVATVKAIGEQLPFKDDSFDFILITFTLSFVNDISMVFQEITRVVKRGGYVIFGIIDKDSFLGEFYSEYNSKFFRDCKFLSTLELVEICKKNNILITEIYQTLFKIPSLIKEPETVRIGFGDGGYVVVKGININKIENMEEYDE